MPAPRLLIIHLHFTIISPLLRRAVGRSKAWRSSWDVRWRDTRLGSWHVGRRRRWHCRRLLGKTKGVSFICDCALHELVLLLHHIPHKLILGQDRCPRASFGHPSGLGRWPLSGNAADWRLGRFRRVFALGRFWPFRRVFALDASDAVLFGRTDEPLIRTTHLARRLAGSALLGPLAFPGTFLIILKRSAQTESSGQGIFCRCRCRWRNQRQGCKSRAKLHFSHKTGWATDSFVARSGVPIIMCNKWRVAVAIAVRWFSPCCFLGRISRTKRLPTDMVKSNF